jgi:cytochrome c2
LAVRLVLLIAAALLLPGCLRARTADQARPDCGSCHAPHYVGIGTCAECHRGNPLSARESLAHARLISGRVAEHLLAEGEAVREGRNLVEAAACRRCHEIAEKGNRLATSLDDVVWARDQAGLISSITAPVENMPRFGFDRAQSEALVAYLLNSAPPGGSREAYRVQFTRDAHRAPSTFEDKCGGCHRMLTPLGPEGVGTQGPNLSGLLTSFYPPTAPGERAWSEKLLAEWVANPRSLRPQSTMPPVVLDAQKLQEVTDQIRASTPLPAR